MFLFCFWDATHTSEGPHFLLCFCFYFTNKHMQTLKFKPNRNLGPLCDTMTMTNKMPITKHKSKQQMVTFFININKHNQYFHKHQHNWLITQKKIKQPQAQSKNPNSNWFLIRILVPRTTRCSSRFTFAALLQYHMQNVVSTTIFVFLRLVRKRRVGSCFDPCYVLILNKNVFF